MALDSRALRLASWNVKGLNETLKTCRVLDHLAALKADVIFIQETHLLQTETRKLKRGWLDKTFHSTFTSKSRGVSILVRKNIPFALDRTVTDPNGRFVAVTGKLAELPVIMISVYAPNWDDDNFFIKLFTLFQLA